MPDKIKEDGVFLCDDCSLYISFYDPWGHFQECKALPRYKISPYIQNKKGYCEYHREKFSLIKFIKKYFLHKN